MICFSTEVLTCPRPAEERVRDKYIVARMAEHELIRVRTLTEDWRSQQADPLHNGEGLVPLTHLTESSPHLLSLRVQAPPQTFLNFAIQSSLIHEGWFQEPRGHPNLRMLKAL